MVLCIKQNTSASDKTNQKRGRSLSPGGRSRRGRKSSSTCEHLRPRSIYHLPSQRIIFCARRSILEALPLCAFCTPVREGERARAREKESEPLRKFIRKQCPGHSTSIPLPKACLPRLDDLFLLATVVDRVTQTESSAQLATGVSGEWVRRPLGKPSVLYTTFTSALIKQSNTVF